ncbi:MAG: VUT family protein [Rhodopila sp.]
MPFLIFVVYLACVPLANWMIGHIGTVCVPQGPCLVPVGFGLIAPSGVLVIGAALVLRDTVQRISGVAWALGAVAIGTTLSWWVTDARIAVASAAAFLISELADCAVYSPLQRRGLVLAVVASGLAGAVVDSAAFLWLAFGSLDFLAGQVVGKAWAVLAAVPLIVGTRRLIGARA